MTLQRAPATKTVVITTLHTGGYAPSLSDFGLASMMLPTQIGPINRPNTDLVHIAEMLPPPWQHLGNSDELAVLNNELLTFNDGGTWNDILNIFKRIDTILDHFSH